jgi:signal transduction histidine kinase/ligand-binding sensor domain-containing protein
MNQRDGRDFRARAGRPCRSVLRVWLCYVFLCAAGSADTAQYRFDSWTTDNGLPQVSVNSILQTRDGFLWLTTFGGLVRYDGLRFQVFNRGNTRGLRTSRFTDLFEDVEGNLWIKTEGEGVTRYRDGAFQTYTTADGLPSNQVSRIDRDGHGNLLFSFSDHLLRWTGAGFAPYTPEAGEPLTGILQRTARGAIWYRIGERVRKFEHGRVTADLAPGFPVRRLFEDTQGRLWLAAEESDQLFMLKDGRLTSQKVDDNQPQFRFFHAFEDRQGRVWFGTHNSLLLFKDGKLTRYTTADGLTRGDVIYTYQDREGTIWVGTTGGLSRVTERAVTTYSVPDGLAAENVYPILEDRKGRIWIGSWTGLTVYAQGRFENVGSRYGVENDAISSLLEDQAGNLWIGCWSGKVVRVAGGRSTVFLTSPTAGLRVRVIYQDRAGQIWLGTANGLIKFKDDTFTSLSTGTPLSGREVFSIQEDRQGQLWLGTDAGLVRYKENVFTPFTERDGSTQGTVRVIHETDDGALWIGTYDSGLYRLRQGRFTRFTTDEGLFDNGAFQIVADGLGNFWISCNLGIYRVRKSELDDFADGRTQKITSIPYTKRDGMLNSEGNGGVQPAGIRASDGRIWFPTQQGVAVINPDVIPFNRQSPPVVIESFVIDTETRTARSPLTIQPGQSYFEIHYSGLSFINPELVKFKYKLEGLDKDWIDAGTRRIAYYSHLPPGRYRFTVIAANRDGMWNEQGASLEIIVLTPFWRMWWFFVLAVCAVAFLAFVLYRWRIRQLQRVNAARDAFARQLIDSQENERRRIAVELHDSLGQSLVLIKNWALLGLRALEPRKQEGTNLDEISKTASSAIKEIREIAYNLGPYQLERIGLSRIIVEMIETVARASSIRVAVEIDPLADLFPKQAEINIFRIVQEAVNNIVKHSAATSASVIIKTDMKQVQLTISDDGRGFAPAASDGNGARPEGFGLLSIDERVRLLKGSWHIESAPGHGTKTHVTLPLERERNGN